MSKISLPAASSPLKPQGAPLVFKQSLNTLTPLGASVIVGIVLEVNLDTRNELPAEGQSMIGIIAGDPIPRCLFHFGSRPERPERPKKTDLFPFGNLIQFYELAQINPHLRTQRVVPPSSRC